MKQGQSSQSRPMVCHLVWLSGSEAVSLYQYRYHSSPCQIRILRHSHHLETATQSGINGLYSITAIQLAFSGMLRNQLMQTLSPTLNAGLLDTRLS